MTQTTHSYKPSLDWLVTQQARMVTLVTQWAEINSYSENLIGLARMSQALQEAFTQLPIPLEIKEVTLEPQQRINQSGNTTSLPLGKALTIKKKNCTGKRRVLLSAHMDTVYSPDSSFLSCTPLDHHRLNGPGVADLKGGLVVLLLALEAFERSPYAPLIDWEVIINPDEEIGSTGSAPLLRERARSHDVGLVFEPALPDGSYVSARKGSVVYTLVARGQSAHAGRDFHLGRNAITLLLPIMQRLHQLTDINEGTTLNLGVVHAGTAVNIVPNLATLQFGLRATTPEALAKAQSAIHAIIHEQTTKAKDLTLFEMALRPPKVFDTRTERFYNQIKRCAQELSMPMQWQPSGGVCDGNLLAAEGLLTIDTLGPVGGNLHTDQEYVELDSLVPRAQLATLLLMQLADGTLVPDEGVVS